MPSSRPLRRQLVLAVVAFHAASLAAAVRSNASAVEAAGFVPGGHALTAAAAAAAAVGTRTAPLGALTPPWADRAGPSSATPAPEASPATEEASSLRVEFERALRESEAELERHLLESQTAAVPAQAASTQNVDHAHHRLGPCRFGNECVRPDCIYEHPPLKVCLPRPAHAQVVVLRRDTAGNFWVLLRRRGVRAQGPGLLSIISGLRDSFDFHSRDSAIRELVGEVGLLDVGRLEQPAGYFHELARKASAQAPLLFDIFGQSRKSDWWVLILDGEGTFSGGVASSEERYADVEPMFEDFGIDTISPAFGHAWVKVSAATKLPVEFTTPSMANRIRQAVFYANHIDRSLASPAWRPAARQPPQPQERRLAP